MPLHQPVLNTMRTWSIPQEILCEMKVGCFEGEQRLCSSASRVNIKSTVGPRKRPVQPDKKYKFLLADLVLLLLHQLVLQGL